MKVQQYTLLIALSLTGLLFIAIWKTENIQTGIKTNFQALNSVELFYDMHSNPIEFDDMLQCGLYALDIPNPDNIFGDVLEGRLDFTGCALIPIIRLSCVADNSEMTYRLVEMAEASCSNRDFFRIIRGDLEYSTGNRELAYQYWISSSSGLWVILNRAELFRKLGRNEDSLYLLQNALRETRNLPIYAVYGPRGTTYEQIGEYAYGQGDWQLVVDAYRQALKYGRIKSFGYAYYGRALREVGEYNESRQILELEIPYYTLRNPIAQAVLFEQLGDTLVDLDDIPGAIDAYQRAILLFEEHPTGINPDRIESLRTAIEKLSLE